MDDKTYEVKFKKVGSEPTIIARVKASNGGLAVMKVVSNYSTADINILSIVEQQLRLKTRILKLGCTLSSPPYRSYTSP